MSNVLEQTQIKNNYSKLNKQIKLKNKNKVCMPEFLNVAQIFNFRIFFADFES
jgi:hypothetical protein